MGSTDRPRVHVPLPRPLFACAARQHWDGQWHDYLVSGDPTKPYLLGVWRTGGDGTEALQLLAFARKQQLRDAVRDPELRTLEVSRFLPIGEQQQIRAELEELVANLDLGMVLWSAQHRSDHGHGEQLCAVGTLGHTISRPEHRRVGYGPDCARHVWHSWTEPVPPGWGAAIGKHPVRVGAGRGATTR